MALNFCCSKPLAWTKVSAGEEPRELFEDLANGRRIQQRLKKDVQSRRPFGPRGSRRKWGREGRSKTASLRTSTRNT